MYRCLGARRHPKLARSPRGQAATSHPKTAPSAHVSDKGTRGEALPQHVPLCARINCPRRVHCNWTAKGELHRYRSSHLLSSFSSILTRS